MVICHHENIVIALMPFYCIIVSISDNKNDIVALGYIINDKKIVSKPDLIEALYSVDVQLLSHSLIKSSDWN